MKLFKLLVVSIGVIFGTVASASLHDCTSGCTIITCSGSECKVYHCSGGVCTPIGSFPNPNQVQGSPIEDGSSTASNFSQTEDGRFLSCNNPSGCAVLTCGDIQCQVVGFHNGTSSALGIVDGPGESAEAMLRLFQAENLLEAMASGR